MENTSVYKQAKSSYVFLDILQHAKHAGNVHAQSAIYHNDKQYDDMTQVDIKQSLINLERFTLCILIAFTYQTYMLFPTLIVFLKR